MSDEAENDVVRAGEFALGLLPPDEMRDFEKRLNNEPDLRDLYARWAEDFANMEFEAVSPPTSVKSKVEAVLFPKPKRPLPWAWIGGVLGSLAGATLAVLLLVAPRFDADLSAPGLSVEATANGYTNLLTVVVAENNPPEGRVHELWIIPKDGVPRSLGVLNAETQRIVVDAAFDGALLAVTVEVPGGSPTGQPTTTPISAVEITSM